METYKNKKSLPISLRLFLFINNVDLKNNNRKYRKPMHFVDARIVAINLFQVDIDKP